MEWWERQDAGVTIEHEETLGVMATFALNCGDGFTFVYVSHHIKLYFYNVQFIICQLLINKAVKNSIALFCKISKNIYVYLFGWERAYTLRLKHGLFFFPVFYLLYPYLFFFFCLFTISHFPNMTCIMYVTKKKEE